MINFQPKTFKLSLQVEGPHPPPGPCRCCSEKNPQKNTNFPKENPPTSPSPQQSNLPIQNFPSKFSLPNSPLYQPFSQLRSFGPEFEASKTLNTPVLLKEPFPKTHLLHRITAPFCESHNKKGANCSFSENRSVDVDVRFDVFFTGGWCVGEDFALGNWFNSKSTVLLRPKSPKSSTGDLKRPTGCFSAPNIFMPLQGRLNRVLPYKHSKLYRFKEIVKAPQGLFITITLRFWTPTSCELASWLPKQSGVLFTIGNLYCTLIIESKPMSGGLIWKKIRCNIHAAFSFWNLPILWVS